MSNSSSNLNPQDVAVLIKIASKRSQPWLQSELAGELALSQSEISKSLSRSKYAGLLDSSGKEVRKQALFEFLQYGVPYVFPVRPGPIVRGIPTAHSASPLNSTILGQDQYVWPWAKGEMKGQAIEPLYSGAVKAANMDLSFHELLALVDALRVGKVRERELAVEELRKRLL